MSVQAATELLDAFRVLPSHAERPRTFMEIADYPHYENACSNILAFFTDPEESHGLGTLVLDALVHTGNFVAPDEKIGKSIRVEREVLTDESNRIDILITSESHAILVENKIRARVDNPFSNYAAYLDRIAEGREQCKILLTLHPMGHGEEWERCGFENVTHGGLGDQVRSMLGHYVADADTRYLVLLLDYLNTLDALKKGTRMNNEFIELLVEREEQVDQFLNGLEELKNEMREKTKELRNRIDIEAYRNVTQLRLWQDPVGRYIDLPHDIRVSDNLVVQVETSIFPRGWEIWIWPRRGDYSTFRDLLKTLEIPFEEYEEDGGVLHRDSFKHKYGENLDGINSLLRDLIDKLATSQEPKGNLDSV